MLRLTLVVVAVLGACALAEQMHPRVSASELLPLWREWKTQHGKNYNGVFEQVKRFEIWEENAKKVMLHNLRESLGLSTFKIGLNIFADLTTEEFTNVKLAHTRKLGSLNRVATRTRTINENPPLTQDWRPKGYVTPVKDQGELGYSWPFAATGGLEGQHFNVTGDLISLSEQQQVDCNPIGISAESAYEFWIRVVGANSEADYPDNGSGKCETWGVPVVATMSSFHQVEQGDENALEDAVGLIGPVSVAVDASHFSFQMYTSGVYYEPDCSPESLDLAMLVVGYNSDAGDEYWIVKNSWGTSWGQDGYIWMSKDRNNNCGIATDASYPIV